MKSFLHLLVILALMLIATGCQTVPYSNRSQFLTTSESEEATMGLEAWSEVLKTEKISNDAFLNAALKRVGPAIASVSDRGDFSWEFKVFESNTANAYCLPGGKVGVYTALYQYTANDAELAAVVGHEVAHAICRHGGERVSQGTLQNLGATVLNQMTSSETAMAIYGVTTNLAAILPYSRKHESEADYVGLILMAKAGYDPQQAIAFWKKFGNLSSSKLEEYFSTHPSGTTRIQGLQDKMNEALSYYEKSAKKGMGTTYSKEELKAAFATYAEAK